MGGVDPGNLRIVINHPQNGFLQIVCRGIVKLHCLVDTNIRHKLVLISHADLPDRQTDLKHLLDSVLIGLRVQRVRRVT